MTPAYLFRLWNDGVELARQDYDLVRESEARREQHVEHVAPRRARVIPVKPIQVRLVCPYCDQEFVGSPMRRGPGAVGPSPHCGDRACFLAHARTRERTRRATSAGAR